MIMKVRRRFSCPTSGRDNADPFVCSEVGAASDGRKDPIIPLKQKARAGSQQGRSGPLRWLRKYFALKQPSNPFSTPESGTTKKPETDSKSQIRTASRRPACANCGRDSSLPTRLNHAMTLPLATRLGLPRTRPEQIERSKSATTRSCR